MYQQTKTNKMKNLKQTAKEIVTECTNMFLIKNVLCRMNINNKLMYILFGEVENFTYICRH